jgi:hypothetical protein
MLDAKSETELNQIKQETIKDINELKLSDSPERLKLKEHFIFNLG